MGKAKMHSLINRTAKQHGVEPALVHAVISAESAYNPKAVSSAGAIGLMQVMPGTAVDYGVIDSSALFDPTVNVKTGVRHLKRLLRKYANDYGRVIMAYNAGEGVVDRTGSNVTYAETLSYTEAVVRRYKRFGGAQPTDDLLRKVAVLRGKRGKSRRKGSRPKEAEPAMLLPKVSPNLQVGNLLSSRQRLPARDSTKSASISSSVPGERIILNEVRPGIDPVIRNATPTVLRHGVRRGVDAGLSAPVRP
ncbi:MAG: lytic transglycosylase domain-containing protein [Thiohalocapsa sp.]